MASKERQLQRWNKLIHPDKTHLVCIICDHIDLYENFTKLYATDIFNAGKIIRHKCPNCSLIFGDLRFLYLSDEEIKNDYEDTYSYFKEGDNISQQYNAIQSIDIFSNKDLKYLDYACGTGKFTDFLKKKTYNITGYDKFVKDENVLNNIDCMMFDVIFSNNFIEHLIDPIKEIKLMLKHLNPNGYLIFMSDCIDEYVIEYTHFHTYYYLGKSLKILFNKLNLTIVENKKIDSVKVIVLKY
jgi:hypothetical protein